MHYSQYLDCLHQKNQCALLSNSPSHTFRSSNPTDSPRFRTALHCFRGWCQLRVDAAFLLLARKCDVVVGLVGFIASNDGQHLLHCKSPKTNKLQSHFAQNKFTIKMMLCAYPTASSAALENRLATSFTISRAA